MKLTLVAVMLAVWPGLAIVSAKPAMTSSKAYVSRNASHSPVAENLFDLSNFGARGDGMSDDGPALQNALDAIAEAGGGTLFVPAGRYAIVTPVQKDFTGLASDVSILGVESLKPVPPRDSDGLTLTSGLDLVSEFAPRTLDNGVAITITGLQGLLIKDIVFIGTPDVETDAFITLSLSDIENATIRHCEFYGLSSLIAGGSIVQIVRSHFNLEQSVFLGCTGNSGVNAPVVQNLSWKGINITDCIFADFGRREELYGKLHLMPPFSWINIGNAATPESNSPRREVAIKNVFLDEGAYIGIASVPYRYPPSAPIDLLYVSGLYMNVSNLASYGHYLYGIESVMIEDAHYGWSHNADASIYLLSVNDAILDKVQCDANADRIRADAATGRLTVINSVYSYLESQSPQTRVIVTDSPEDDPVQYVRRQFLATLNRDPDPAAHYYWSNEILRCADDLQCVATQRAALSTYLHGTPTPTFAIGGQVLSENGTPLAGVRLTLAGSQSTTTLTDADGRYLFSGLPTSGAYTVTPDRANYAFDLPQQSITTPAGDMTANFTALVHRYTISGRVINESGEGIAGAGVVLTGAQTEAMTTGASGNYSFTVPEGDYRIKVSRNNYTFGSSATSYENLLEDQTFNFAGTLVNYSISGRVLNGNTGLSDVTISLTGSQHQSTITNGGGDYSFTVPAEGDYTITPSLEHYTFAAASNTFTNLSGNRTSNFNANLERHAITGRTATDDGQAIGGVVVQLTGTETLSTMTDDSGDYSFPNLAGGGHYTVSVSKPDYNFAVSTFDYPELSSDQVANFSGALNSYVLSGHITSDGEGLAGATVTLGGSLFATLLSDAEGNYSFTVPAKGDYIITPAKKDYLFTPESLDFQNLGSNGSGNFNGTLQRVIEFGSNNYIVTEGTRTISVTVKRSGDTAKAAEVIYSAKDGSARQRSDVIPVIGLLDFAPGETSKEFIIFITDDSYVEDNETIALELRNVVGGELGNINSATLTIIDNDLSQVGVNPIDDSQFFVRQQYRDFLNRPPDSQGLAFWSNQITSCGTDAACIADRRMNVSAAFFLSIEFQQTGFLVYRLYKAAFARAPQHLDEFLLDTRTMGQGVIVGNPGWEQFLETKKTAFTESFVARARFSEAYPLELTPVEFVNQLNANAGSPLTTDQIAAAVNEFAGAASSEEPSARARVLRRVAENQTFSERQTNPAFVLMQYFGYLQRNPDELPDNNLDGYTFWLNKLAEFGGDFRRAEMVKAFIVSGEYRARFGSP